MEKENVLSYRHQTLAKSNFFIGTKYKASILENQITYLAMLKIQEREYKEKADGIYVTMSAAEIKNATHKKGGSFYHDLMEVANQMTGNNLGIVDEENERFEFVTLINKATYEDAEFTIRFANELKTYLIDVTDNFTKIPKKIAMGLRRNAHSFPLYQMLKKQCYYPKDYKGEKNYVFSVLIGLSELKLSIGVVNIKDSPDVKKALISGRGTTEDYDKAVEKSKDQKYMRWSNFNTQCLKKAIKEINTESDIYVEYTPLKKGVGGRIYAVDFTVWLNGTEKKNESPVKVSIDKEGKIVNNISDEERFIFYLKTSEVLKDFNLGFGDIVNISNASNYNIKKIENAAEMIKKSNVKIDNVVGWLIACIKEEWKQTEKESSKKNNNGFHNFPEREYSEEESMSLETLLRMKAMEE